MPYKFAPASAASRPLYVVPADGLEEFLKTCDAAQVTWIKANKYSPKLGKVLIVPDQSGAADFAIVGFGKKAARNRVRFALSRARAALPGGTWRLEGTLKQRDLNEAALGWLLAGYRFNRYSKIPIPSAMLIAPDGIDAAQLEIIAEAECLTRDLINIPASDMGPADLEASTRQMAKRFQAKLRVTTGDDLLKDDLPMIHAVGRSSDQAPRLLDMRWGASGPRLTLVGKGVCFDSGGLNLKPGASMGLMKKDMGGAAAVLGLAQMIMATGMQLRLRVLIPAVENSISAGAMRPSDILSSRKGLSVEINNTDAEGRLVLADALAVADEEKPDLILSMATLTGAARVAVGSDLAPFYATKKRLAKGFSQAGRKVRDPLWQMPFWDPYEALIEPGIADLDNAPKGGMAGSITAALFLRRFVTDTPAYAHFDIHGWQVANMPARPKGGVGQATRAIFAALPTMLKL